MTQSQAVEIARPHIDKSNEVIVTSDGNVFFEQQKNYAEFHAKDLNLELFVITKKDMTKQAPKEKTKEVEKPSKKNNK